MKMVAALIMGARFKAAFSRRQDACPSERSDHAPEPFQDPRNHVTEQEQRRRPYEGRDEIGDLKLDIGHLENARGKRYRGPQGAEEAADEDARHAPAPDEGFASRQNFRIARQGPHLRDVFLVFVAEPIRDPIAERGADAAGKAQRPEADAAHTDQGADRNQRSPGRNQKGDEGKGLTERQDEHDWGSPSLMVAHEIRRGVRKILHLRKMPFRPVLNSKLLLRSNALKTGKRAAYMSSNHKGGGVAHPVVTFFRASVA